MKPKPLRTAVAVMLVISMAVTNLLFVYSADDYIRDIGRLGDIIHYNGIVFDYFESAQADIEGALAVGGQSKIGTSGQYDVGASAHHHVMGAYPNPSNYPTLLLGSPTEIGRGSGTSYVNVYGGPAVMKQSYEPEYYSKPTRFYAAKGAEFAVDDIVDQFFTETRDTVTATVKALNAAAKGNIPSDKFTGYWSASGFTLQNITEAMLKNYEPDPEQFTLGGTANVDGKDIVIINVTSSSTLHLSEVKLSPSVMDYDAVVFNFPDAVNVSFSGGALLVGSSMINTGASVSAMPEKNAELAEYASKIVWNFPRAQYVAVSHYGVVGSVLAPYAYLDANGGSINGMLVSDSFKTAGGMELHSFKMKRPVFTKEEPEDPSEPEPEVLARLRAVKRDIDQPEITLAEAEFLMEYWDEELASPDWTPFDYEGGYPGGVYKTPGTGILYASRMPLGKYRIKELAPPVGYEILDICEIGGEVVSVDAEGYFTFELTAEHAENELLVTVYNKTKTYGLTLFKVDQDDSGVKLEGARFTLYFVNGEAVVPVGEVISEADGSMELEGLQAGTYYLIETQAPDGYVFNHVVYTIEVDDTAIKVYKAGQLLSEPYEIENEKIPEPDPQDPEPTYGLEVVKLDGQDGSALSGASFELYYWEEFSGIDPGMIIIEPDDGGEDEGSQDMPEENLPEDEQEEDTEPTGHDGREDADSPEESPADSGDAEGPETEKEDNDSSEADSETQEQQAGAPVGKSGQIGAMTGVSAAPAGLVAAERITDEEVGEAPLATPVISLDGPAGEWVPVEDEHGQEIVLTTVTSGRAYQDGLKAGEYKLVEVASPAGYEPQGGEYFVTIEDDAQTPVVSITVTNDPRGEIVIDKVDAEGRALSGAVFALYREVEENAGSGTGIGSGRWVKVDAVTVVTGGRTTFAKLRPGSYWVAEVTAPGGYKELAAPIGPFEIGNADNFGDGNKDPLYNKYAEVENEKIYEPEINVKFRKISSDPDGGQTEGLSGAEFELERYDFTSRGWVPFKTGISSGADGYFEISQLNAGLYRLVETKAPDGFELSNYNGYTFMITADMTQEMWGDEPVEIVNHPIEPEDPQSPDPPVGALIPADLRIQKYGDYNNNGTPGTVNLEGAIFSLYKKYETHGGDDSDIGEDLGYILYRGWLVTGDSGQVEIRKLYAGSYKLVEIQAPSGYSYDYENPPAYYFTVGNDGTLEITSVENDSSYHLSYDGVNDEYILSASNYALPSFALKVLKLDQENETTPLSGAVFDLYRQYTRAAASPGILLGDDEAEAQPEPYSFWDIYKRVESDTNGQVDLNPASVGTYLLEEVQAPTVAAFSYTRGATTKYLFEIMVDEELTTDPNDPVLYVNYAGRRIDQEDDINLRIFNSPLYPDADPEPEGQLTIIKVDAEGEPITESPASFRFYYEQPVKLIIDEATGEYEESSVKEYYEKMQDVTPVWTPYEEDARVFTTSERDGSFVLKHITEGTYFAEEIEAPEGFQLIDPVEVTISFTNGKMTIDHDNPYITKIEDISRGDDLHLVVTIANEEVERSSSRRRRRPSTEILGVTEPEDPEDPAEENPDREEPVDPAEDSGAEDGPDSHSSVDPEPAYPGNPSDELDNTPKTGELDMTMPLVLFNLFACGYIMFYLRDCFRRKKAKHQPKY